MTERESFQFEQKKRKMLAAAGYRCKWCGGGATELAHRAARTRDNAIIAGKMYFDTIEAIPPSQKAITKIGYMILNHERNLDVTCSRCNSKSNIGHQGEVMRQHLEKVITVGMIEGIW